MPHWITGVEREGDISLRADKRQGLILEFTEHYTVISDYVEKNMWVVMRDAIPTTEARSYLPVNGLPLPSVTIALDGICICQSVSGQRDPGNPRKWKFTAQFSSSVEPGKNLNQNGQPPATPEQVIPLRETMFETVTRTHFDDYLGNPFVNGAGNLYSTPIETEDVLSRWEFAQFEPVYIGNFSGGVQNRLQKTVHNFIVYPPGVYASSAPNAPLIGVTDATINYFNGCINQRSFRGMSGFTLMLKVRRSVTGYYYGALRRLTEYSITYDPKNWLTKVANSSPYFVGPKLNENGQPFADWQSNEDSQQLYPYIYYTKAEENADSDLSIDQNGPLGRLGSYSILPSDQPTDFPIPPNNPFVFTDRFFLYSVLANPTPDNRALFAQGYGTPQYGYKIVKTASTGYTCRAVHPQAPKDFNYLPYLNHNVLDFNLFLRVQ